MELIYLQPKLLVIFKKFIYDYFYIIIIIITIIMYVSCMYVCTHDTSCMYHVYVHSPHTSANSYTVTLRTLRYTFLVTSPLLQSCTEIENTVKHEVIKENYLSTSVMLSNTSENTTITVWRRLISCLKRGALAQTLC